MCVNTHSLSLNEEAGRDERLVCQYALAHSEHQYTRVLSHVCIDVHTLWIYTCDNTCVLILNMSSFLIQSEQVCIDTHVCIVSE